MFICKYVHTVELEDFVWFIVHLGAPVGDAAIAVGRGEELSAPNPRHASQNLGETDADEMHRLKHTFLAGMSELFDISWVFLFARIWNHIEHYGAVSVT